MEALPSLVPGDKNNVSRLDLQVIKNNNPAFAERNLAFSTTTPWGDSKQSPSNFWHLSDIVDKILSIDRAFNVEGTHIEIHLFTCHAISTSDDREIEPLKSDYDLAESQNVIRSHVANDKFEIITWMDNNRENPEVSNNAYARNNIDLVDETGTIVPEEDLHKVLSDIDDMCVKCRFPEKEGVNTELCPNYGGVTNEYLIDSNDNEPFLGYNAVDRDLKESDCILKCQDPDWYSPMFTRDIPIGKCKADSIVPEYEGYLIRRPFEMSPGVVSKTCVRSNNKQTRTITKTNPLEGATLRNCGAMV